MQACGNVGSAPTIFYTFGAATVQVRKGLRDTRDPKGIMWNDALPREFTEMVNGRKKAQFKLDVPPAFGMERLRLLILNQPHDSLQYQLCTFQEAERGDTLQWGLSVEVNLVSIRPESEACVC